jgi:hypothetical protein
MQPFVLDVSDDLTRLTFSVPTHGPMPLELGVADVDALMRRLSECRAIMTPVHPAEPPANPELVYRTDNLLYHISACGTVPAIEIAMQHPGLGWIVTRLSREQVEDIQTSIDFALLEIPQEATAA